MFKFCLPILVSYPGTIPAGQIFQKSLTGSEICIIFGPQFNVADYVITLSPTHGTNTVGVLNEQNMYNHCFPGLHAATVYIISITSQSAGQGQGSTTPITITLRTREKNKHVMI